MGLKNFFGMKQDTSNYVDLTSSSSTTNISWTPVIKSPVSSGTTIHVEGIDEGIVKGMWDSPTQSYRMGRYIPGTNMFVNDDPNLNDLTRLSPEDLKIYKNLLEAFNDLKLEMDRIIEDSGKPKIKGKRIKLKLFKK